MSGTIMAALIAKARNRVTWHFTSAGATSKETATKFPTPTSRLDRRVFERRVAFGLPQGVAGAGAGYPRDRRVRGGRRDGGRRVGPATLPALRRK